MSQRSLRFVLALAAFTVASGAIGSITISRQVWRAPLSAQDRADLAWVAEARRLLADQQTARDLQIAAVRRLGHCERWRAGQLVVSWDELEFYAEACDNDKDA